MVFNLPYQRFTQLTELVIEKKEEEIREAYVLEAFNAWLQGAGGKKKFGAFLKSLKLTNPTKKKEPQLSKEEQEAIKQRNLENAKRILLLDKTQRNEG